MHPAQPGLTSVDSMWGREQRSEFHLSAATFNHQQQDLSKINEEIYQKVKLNDIKNIKFFLGTSDGDTNQTQGVDLTIIIDNKNNTLLHHAAAQDSRAIFQELITYALKYNGREDVLNWVNLPNNQGYQCQHIACHRGNLHILELLQKLGVDFKAKNKFGQSCLHIAAQADSTQVLYFLYTLGLDLNQRDNQNGTPLHQASYFGAEVCANLLLAWGCEVNVQDNEGQTPLHLSAQSGNYKIIKRLLYYGANPKLETVRQQKAESIAEEHDFFKQSKLIKEYQSNCCTIQNICGRHSRAKINEQNRLQLSLFIGMMFLLIIYQIIYTIYWNIYGIIQGSILLLNIIFTIWVVNSDPGSLPNYRNKMDKFKLIIQQISNSEICAECHSYKPIRSKHCDFCKRCVAVYDHHCPWINNCVGCKNHLLFMIFISILMLTLIYSVLLIIIQIGWCNILQIDQGELALNKLLKLINLDQLPSFFNDKQYIQYSYIAILLTILVMFILLLSTLFYVQIRNIIRNETTFETINRAHKDYRTSQVQDSDSDSSSQRLLAKSKSKTASSNCLDMLCRNKKQKNYFYLFREDTSSLTTAVLS